MNVIANSLFITAITTVAFVMLCRGTLKQLPKALLFTLTGFFCGYSAWLVCYIYMLINDFTY